MALGWHRVYTASEYGSLSALALVAIDIDVGHALRRSITQTQLTIHNPDAADVDEMIAFGAMFAIEVTTIGFEPEPLNEGNLNDRELLHFDVAPGRLIAGQNDAIKYIAIPGDTGSMTIDTKVQRAVQFEPGLRIWASWALRKIPSGLFNIRVAQGWHMLEDDGLS